MSSQSPRTNKARWLRRLLTDEGRRELLLSLVSVDGFRLAREDVIDLYACAYEKADDITDQFDNKSRTELRNWAVEPYFRITDYDPHEAVMGAFRLVERTVERFEKVLLVILFAASVLSLHDLSLLVVDGLELADARDGVVPLSVIVGFILYGWLLKSNTFAHQTLAKELRVGEPRVRIRDESRIVGYGVWNRSLLGQTGLILVAFFFLLRSLPHLPLLHRIFDDPAGYVKGIIEDNMDIFLECDGWLAATKRLFQRIRGNSR